MINRLVVSIFFHFHPYLGKIPKLTNYNIFQMGLKPPTSSTCLLFYKVLDRMDSNGIQQKKTRCALKRREGGRFLPKLFSVLGKRIFGG